MPWWGWLILLAIVVYTLFGLLGMAFVRRVWFGSSKERRARAQNRQFHRQEWDRWSL